MPKVAKHFGATLRFSRVLREECADHWRTECQTVCSYRISEISLPRRVTLAEKEPGLAMWQSDLSNLEGPARCESYPWQVHRQNETQPVPVWLVNWYRYP